MSNDLPSSPQPSNACNDLLISLFVTQKGKRVPSVPVVFLFFFSRHSFIPLSLPKKKEQMTHPAGGNPPSTFRKPLLSPFNLLHHFIWLEPPEQLRWLIMMPFFSFFLVQTLNSFALLYFPDLIQLAHIFKCKTFGKSIEIANVNARKNFSKSNSTNKYHQYMKQWK